MRVHEGSLRGKSMVYESMRILSNPYQSAPVIDAAGDHIHTISISEAGNSIAHNNMMPYISVYCWKRTA